MQKIRLALAWNKSLFAGCLIAFMGMSHSAFAQGLQEIPSQAAQSIELRALNKMTARASSMKMNIGDITKFDAIEMQVHSCWSAPVDQRPEHKALIEITELVENEPPKTLFHGWMFASSPALNALEHPVYDIAVIRCLPGRVK